METGIELIAAERKRQVQVEGWTPEHDDEHHGGDMAAAAACYVSFSAASEQVRDHLRDNGMSAWPWALKWWKPSPGDAPHDRIRELVKAGALIAAEIDRLNRLRSNDVLSRAAENPDTAME